MRGEKRSFLFIVCGNFCCVLSLVLIAASMGTERWLVFTVDRTRFTPGQLASTSDGVAALYTHTRHRGMFRECYPGSDTAFLGSHKDVVDKNCFMLMFSDEAPGTTVNYRTKVGLHTGFMCAFLISEILLIIIYFLGFCLCIKYMQSPIWLVALATFFATFLAVLGMAFFHFSWYMEWNIARNTVSTRQSLYNEWPQYIKDATTISFKESYVTAWVGIFFAILATIFFTAASCSRRSKSHGKKAHRHGVHQHDIPVVVQGGNQRRQDIPVIVQGESPRVFPKQPLIYADQLANPKQPIIVPTELYAEAKRAASVVYDNRAYTNPVSAEPRDVYARHPDDDRMVFRELNPEKKPRRREHRSKHRQHREVEREEERESSGGVPQNELDLLRRSDKRPTSFRSQTADPLFLY